MVLSAPATQAAESGVWAWGDNEYGQLGDGTTTGRDTPVQIKGEGGVGYLSGVTAIVAGYYHSLALQGNVPPAAAPETTINPDGDNPLEVNFHSSGSDDFDGTIAAWQWRLGDVDGPDLSGGPLSTDSDFDHVFSQPGTHYMWLRVQDNDGAWSNWESVEVVVKKSVPNDFDGDGKSDILYRRTGGASPDYKLYIYFMDGLQATNIGFVNISSGSAWTVQ